MRQKIEAQYAKAIGVQSVTGQSDEAVLLEIQQAAMGSEARSRLDSMRQELGLPAPGQSAALGTGTTAGTGQEPAALGGGNPVAASPPTPPSPAGRFLNRPVPRQRRPRATRPWHRRI